MDNSFGGMSDDVFFLGYDAMIPEDDPDSINYDSREFRGSNSKGYYSGGCCCIAVLTIIVITVLLIMI